MKPIEPVVAPENAEENDKIRAQIEQLVSEKTKLIEDLQKLQSRYHELGKNVTNIKSLDGLMKMQIDDQNTLITEMMLNLSRDNKAIETEKKLLDD